MNLFVLTTETSRRDGWARYSADMIAVLSATGFSCTVAEKKGSKNGTLAVLPEYIRYRANFFLAPWYAWRLLRAARSADVIHSFVEPYAYIAFWLSSFTGKPYVITAHGTYATLPYGLDWVRRTLHHHALANAAVVICVSAFTQKQLALHGITNTVVIHNGINADRIARGDITPWGAREDMVLSVGILKHRKGQHVVLKALHQLADAHPKLKYVMVGSQSDAVYLQKLHALIKEYSLEDRVDMRMNISDEDLALLYDQVKAFAMPSVTKARHFEGFGLVYLEANGRGLPVIGSKDTGAEDAIQDGRTGMLVPQEDSAAVARAIEALITQESTWEGMSTSGLKWAQEHRWEAKAAEYAKIYATL